MNVLLEGKDILIEHTYLEGIEEFSDSLHREGEINYELPEKPE